jgi:hypothetical protein
LASDDYLQTGVVSQLSNFGSRPFRILWENVEDDGRVIHHNGPLRIWLILLAEQTVSAIHDELDGWRGSTAVYCAATKAKPVIEAAFSFKPRKLPALAQALGRQFDAQLALLLP